MKPSASENPPPQKQPRFHSARLNLAFGLAMQQGKLTKEHADMMDRLPQDQWPPELVEALGLSGASGVAVTPGSKLIGRLEPIGRR